LIFEKGVASGKYDTKDYYQSRPDKQEGILEGIEQEAVSREREIEKLRDQEGYDQQFPEMGVMRRAFFEQAVKEDIDELVNRQRRSTDMLRIRGRGLLAFDIDDLKVVNDTMGHLMGDVMLESFVQSVRENMRDIDFFGRGGVGDEFRVWLSAENLDALEEGLMVKRTGEDGREVASVMEEIRVRANELLLQRIEDSGGVLKWTRELDGKGGLFDFSAGLSKKKVMPGEDPQTVLWEMYLMSDAAMYRDKAVHKGKV